MSTWLQICIVTRFRIRDGELVGGVSDPVGHVEEVPVADVAVLEFGDGQLGGEVQAVLKCFRQVVPSSQSSNCKVLRGVLTESAQWDTTTLR